ncbi:MAG: MarR family transcriptional regulator [Nanoarchaeota archaeon]
MKNKIAGFIVIGIALLMGFIIYSYNSSLLSLATETCSVSGPSCLHEAIANKQIKINIVILVLVVIIGFYLIFFSKEERIVHKIMRVKEQMQPKKMTKENYQQIMSKLEKNEKKVLELVIDAQGSVMQSELTDKMGMTKVKITRILDRLEGKGLIERKRRGMTNIVILKQ